MTPVPVLIPPAVVPGDRVGVAALSGAVAREELNRGLGCLRRLGFEPVLAANLQAALEAPSLADGKLDSETKSGEGAYALAGSDQERLDGFHRLLEDDSLGAILFARGGYGLLRILPGIDWELLAKRPRSFVGYSDLTPLLGQIVDRLGWQTLHGPMVASDLSKDDFAAEEERSLIHALAGDFSTPIPLQSLAGGALEQNIEAPLAGGCLSLLTATLGTEHSCAYEGRILFIEDLGEPDYRLDRMLTHLDLSGKFVGISALLIGHLCPILPGKETGRTEQTRNSCNSQLSGGCAAANNTPERPLWLTGLMEASHRYGWPIFRGVPSGHGRPNLTLPLGRLTRIDPALSALTFP